MANQFYEITLKALNKLESIDNINSNVIAKYWQEALIDLNKNYSKGCPQNSFASLILNNHVVFEGILFAGFPVPKVRCDSCE